MNVTRCRWNELTPQTIAVWDELRRSSPAYASPYFHPRFTQCVSEVRKDVEIAVLHEGNETVGVLPFQRGPGWREGRPVGGRLSDFHGVLLRTGTRLDPAKLMRGCRLVSLTFDHLVLDDQPLACGAIRTDPSPWLDLSNGFDAYRRERNDSGTQEIKQVERKERKFEREVGPLTFRFHTADRGVFDTMRKWKSQQYLETGVADVFSFPWTVQLLERILACEDPGFRAVMSTLHHEDKLLAVHYAMQSGNVLHSWFPAYDREFARHSPGRILMLRLAEACPAHGITRIDLGKGVEQYKVNFASRHDMVGEGHIEYDPLARLARRAWAGLRDWVKSSRTLSAAASVPLKLLRPLRERRSFR